MWEALPNFLNINTFKPSSDKRYLNVIYPFHPECITCVITISYHPRLLQVMQKMVLFCIMVRREVCRMLLAYFEVLHIHHCLLALEFRNDGYVYGSLMIKEISIDYEVQLTRMPVICFC